MALKRQETKMEFFFVRHGETEFNKQHKLMGQRVDAPLDYKGLRQAHEVISKLPRNFAALYSSPLKRALMTAKIIGDYFDVPVQVKNDLKERDFGSLSGKTWQEIESETGEKLSKLDEQLVYDYRPYDGESAIDVRQRLENFIAEVKGKYKPEDAIVVVTHFGIISLMSSIYVHKEHHKLFNISVHKFVV